MALMIRFRQQGKNNRRCYRLVVADRRSPRDGKCVETLGWYDPLGKENHIFQVKEDRLQFWLSKGAKMSEKAHQLVKKAAPQIIQSLNAKKALKKKKPKKAVASPTPKKEAKATPKPKKTTTKQKKEE